MNIPLENIFLSAAAASVVDAVAPLATTLISDAFGSNFPSLSKGDQLAAAMAIALRITNSLAESAPHAAEKPAPASPSKLSPRTSSTLCRLCSGEVEPRGWGAVSRGWGGGG